MKITKSMFINPTSESRELYICTVNNGDVYRLIQSVYKNLYKKYTSGKYDKELAIVAWYHVVNQESKIYNRDFDYMFTVNERYNAAIELESHYYDYMLNNEESV